MQAIVDYVGCVAENFKSKLGPSLVEVYKIGSLAHGGFSQIYSDIDLGLILSCPNPPSDMDRMIAEAKALDDDHGKKLSIFWGNPECGWGRLPVLDRLDLLDHGVPLLNEAGSRKLANLAGSRNSNQKTANPTSARSSIRRV
jgi:predicted nucleotidyltransferase